MPVLPAVGSIISEPGSRTPRRSASRIIPSAARSLTDPPGFMYSSLANSSPAGGGSGLGEATARMLIASGARVVVADLEGEAPEGGRFVETDVTNEDRKSTR